MSQIKRAMEDMKEMDIPLTNEGLKEYIKKKGLKSKPKKETK